MTTIPIPNVITTTQAYWAALGFELEEEKAEEIALKHWWVEVRGLAVRGMKPPTTRETLDSSNHAHNVHGDWVESHPTKSAKAATDGSGWLSFDTNTHAPWEDLG